LVRTVLLYVLASLLVATAWLRLENGAHELRKVGLMVALAFLPAAAIAVGKRRTAIGVGVASLLAASSEAFGIPLTEARPGGQHDFFGPVLGAFKDGFLAFYDTDLPFRPDAFPFMHDVVLVAVFAFCAAVGVLVAARKPVGAALALVFAIGWPATLVPGTRPLTLGVLALAGVLAVLFLFRAGARPVRGLGQGLAVALVLLAAAAAASSSGAVSKGAFLDWQGWDFYNQPDTPVGVRYVWDSHYGGIHFPKKKTVVYRIRVPGPERGLYWRATTLDDYTGNGWQENLNLGPASERDQIDAAGLPAKSRDQRNWLRQDVTVASIRDTHLVGSAQPVRWRPPGGTASSDQRGSIVVLPNALHRDQRYTVWSYVPRVKPSQLAKAGVVYPSGIERYLEVIQGGARVLPFATPNRDDLMHVFLDATYQDDVLVQANRPLYDVARQVVGDARTPYAATVALESWFRRAQEGGFHYDEQPPTPSIGQPALVSFVTQTKRGYCQHFAGAMALMLRYLGIPARVAAGFTSGSYDTTKHEWKVTDHEAHTWVEVYFPGWGWLPFDPTPGRGLLAAEYSTASPVFDTKDAAGFLRGEGSSDTLSRLAQEVDRAKGRPGLQGAAGAANPSSGRGGVTIVRDKGPSIVLLALLVLIAAAGLVMGLKAVRRAVRFAGRDPRALASACRRDIIGFIADQGFDLPPSATLADVGRALDRYFAVDATPFVRFATVARFGPTREAEEAVRRARRELRRVRRDLRNRMSAMSRIRGAVSLRSLTM
jgi:transglutaminase-like putative cysteine protease